MLKSYNNFQNKSFNDTIEQDTKEIINGYLLSIGWKNCQSTDEVVDSMYEEWLYYSYSGNNGDDLISWLESNSCQLKKELHEKIEEEISAQQKEIQTNAKLCALQSALNDIRTIIKKDKQIYKESYKLSERFCNSEMSQGLQQEYQDKLKNLGIELHFDIPVSKSETFDKMRKMFTYFLHELSNVSHLGANNDYECSDYEKDSDGNESDNTENGRDQGDPLITTKRIRQSLFG